MILDSFANKNLYLSLNPHFSKAFEFLAQDNLKELADGRYEIDGDKVFAMISRMPGRKAENAPLEAHRKYIDIQVCLKGIDSIGWKPLNRCTTVTEKYCENKDIMFYAGEKDAFCNIREGQFAIFFPSDAHAPLIADEDLHKVVVKVAVS